MRSGAHTLLAASDPKGPNQSANWPRYAELYGHVIASGAVESDQPWVRELVMNVAKYLWYWGTTRSRASSWSRPGRPGGSCSARRTSRRG